MNIEEVIKLLELGLEIRGLPFIAKVYEEAIKGLKKLKKYEELGTIEEIKEVMKSKRVI